MCARASVPSISLRLWCIAFCRLRYMALAVLPYVLLPVRFWMRWCAIPWALASAPASSSAHALAGAYTAPWHRAHRSILRVKENGGPGEGGCWYGTTDGGCLLLGNVFDDGGYVEVLRWGFQSMKLWYSNKGYVEQWVDYGMGRVMFGRVARWLNGSLKTRFKGRQGFVMVLDDDGEWV
ncbi:hypothetical protein V6N13_074186 [Hibiscus sabdariffa]